MPINGEGKNMQHVLKWASIIVIGCAAALHAQLSENRESPTPGKEFVQANNLIYRYVRSHGALPANWSDVWDVKEIASRYPYFEGRPLVHRQVAFIDLASQLVPDNSGTRIVAITRSIVERPFGPIKDEKPEWVGHRLIILMTKDGKIKMESVKAEQPFRGVDLEQLVLKEPDLTDTQLADTASEMFRMGFNADQIYTALGSDAVEVVKKSGKLDPVFKKDLDAPLMPTPAPTTAQASASVVPTSTPATKAGSSGFPIWPAAILGAVIVAGAVFLVRRRSR